MSAQLATCDKSPGLVWCGYDVLTGAVVYVLSVLDNPDSDRIITEAEALHYYGANDPYGRHPCATRFLAEARRIQQPLLLDTARRNFSVLVADDAHPVLMDGVEHVAVAS